MCMGGVYWVGRICLLRSILHPVNPIVKKLKHMVATEDKADKSVQMLEYTSSDYIYDLGKYI